MNQTKTMRDGTAIGIDWRELAYWVFGWVLLALWLLLTALVVLSISAGLWGYYLLAPLFLFILPATILTFGWTSRGRFRKPPFAFSVIIGFWVLIFVVSFLIFPAVPAEAETRDCGSVLTYVVLLVFHAGAVAQNLVWVVRAFPPRPLITETRRFWLGVLAIVLVVSAAAVWLSRDLLLLRASRSGSLHWGRVLLSISADPNIKIGTTNALLSAAQRGNEPMVSEFLAGPVKSDDLLAQAALRVAALRGFTGICEKLIQAGVDVNSGHTSGRTPLMNAAWGGHPHIIDLLLRSGANLEARDDAGQSAFIVASERGHVEVMKKLAASGADVNARDHEGRTALHLAAERPLPDRVRLLIQLGASPSRRDSQGLTAADYARRVNSPTNLELLSPK